MRASVLYDHAHFFTTETSDFDRHAKERVFVVLVAILAFGAGSFIFVSEDERRKTMD